MKTYRDRLLDTLLWEHLGGQEPSDVAGRVLARAFPRRRSAWPLAAAAALLLATSLTVAWLLRSPSYPEPTATGAFQVVAGTAVERKSTLNAVGSAHLDLGGYVRADLTPGCVVRLEGQRENEALFLERGEVECEVQPGRGGFAVHTAIGTVSVRGTHFTVRLHEGETNMLDKRLTVRVLVGAVVVSGAWGLVELGAGQQQVFGQEKKAQEGKKGITIGILVGKEKAAIEVKADGEEKARKYVPRWVGGAPAQGGGPDKTMLKVFSGLKVGSRVEIQWVFEERLRALNVKVLAPPGKK